MKFYFSRLFIYCVPLLLSSCNCNNGNDEPAGGPCAYETKIYPATLILVKRKDRFTADLIFKVTDKNGTLYRDSVSWYKENNNWINVPDILENEITVGKNYKYIIEEIKTGSCTPRIEKLILEKFDK